MSTGRFLCFLVLLAGAALLWGSTGLQVEPVVLETGEQSTSFPLTWPPPGSLAAAVAATGWSLQLFGLLGFWRLGRRRPTPQQAVTAVLLAGLLTVGAAELAVRRHSEGRLPYYLPHPILLWDHPPHLAPPAETNSHGLRGPDRAIPKPPGVLRIVLLGASSMWGYEVSYRESLAGRLEEVLNGAAPPGLRVEVVNAALQGYSSFQAAHMLKLKGLAYQPDLLVTGFAIEPTATNMRDRDRVAATRLGRAVDTLLFRSDLFLLLRKTLFRLRADALRQELDRQATLSPEAQTVRVPVEDFRKDVGEILDVARQNHIRCAFLRLPRRPSTGRQDPLRRYWEAIADQVRQSGSLEVDAFSEWMAGETEDLFLPPDDPMHPTAAGHARLARQVAEALWSAGWVPRRATR